DPLESPDQVGAGERMAIQLAATGSGYTLLPASVARMFGQKDVIVQPTNIHPGWDVGLAWRKAADSDLIQDFIGVTKGRRTTSHRETQLIRPGSTTAGSSSSMGSVSRQRAMAVIT